MTLELPWPPSLNRYYRHNRGRTHISEQGLEYRHAVAVLCHRKGTMGKRRLMVSVDAYPPDRRERDLDNLLKCLLDSMQHAGIYEDDSQIDYLDVKRMPKVPGGRLLINIREAK